MNKYDVWTAVLLGLSIGANVLLGCALYAKSRTHFLPPF